MKEKNILVERDRDATEKRLVDTIGLMISENGFEKIGINAVSARSGVSKILIYRYFGSIEELMAAYIRRHDFWINLQQEFPDKGQLRGFIKKMFREQVSQLRDNPVLRRLYRWELSSENKMIVELREQRERKGLERIRMVCELTGCPEKEIAALASILSASVTYLVMLEDFCPFYNGIPLNEKTGWDQICEGMELIIDKYFSDKLISD